MRLEIFFLTMVFFYSNLYGQIKILSVTSEKINYLPNENAQFTAALENQGSRASKVRIQCQLVRRINEVFNVGSKFVEIPANEKSDVTFEYQLDGVEFGYEVRMWIEGKSDVAREFFGVSQNVIRIGIFGNSDYQNYVDVFAWSPDSFGDHSPQDETWWSGQGNYDMSKTELKARIANWHKRGIKALTYALPAPGGPPGNQLLLEHPDWACYNRFGQLGGLFVALDMWSLKNWNHNQHRNDLNQKWYFWNTWTVNFYDPKTVEYGSHALIDGAKMFGWDGVRFDSQFDVYGGYDSNGIPTDHGEDRDALNARNMKIVKEYIRRTYPDFLFGHNYGAVQDPPTELDKVVCEEGGLVMDEGITNASMPQDPDNPWIRFAQRIIREVETTAKIGGNQVIFEFNRGQRPVIADVDYGLSFCFAGGGRPYAWNYKATKYRLDQFATRYSEYLMNNDIKRLRNPDEIFSVNEQGGIWWRDWAAVYKPANGQIQYILHLFNAPLKKGIGDTPYPEPQKDIPVAVRLPGGQEFVDAWLVSPEPETNARQLTHSKIDQRINFTIDEIHIWKFLVINARGAE